MRLLLITILIFTKLIAFEELFEKKSSKSDYSNSNLLKAELEFTKLFNKEYNNLNSSIKKKNYYVYINDAFFVFKENSKSKITLQAPHAFSDLFTKKLAFLFFREGDFFALATNTKHRKIEDLAHINNSTFNSFTKAFSKIKLNNYIFQIHGFSNKKRVSIEGKNSEIILSNGTKYPSKDLYKLNECFKSFSNSKLFPIEIKELGGTTNTNKKIVNYYGGNEFIHVEFNYSIRKKLLKDKGLRQKVLRCLDILY